MKLLIVTQSVDTNDPILGFFHRWIEEFSEHCEIVEIICLRSGRYDFKKHVQVHTIPTLGKIRRAIAVITLAYRLRKRYDSVFVHMNPEYLIVCGWLWRLMGKKSVLWYTHRQVNVRLRLATFFANRVCTASLESFRLPTKKLKIKGHGIDGSIFACQSRQSHSSVRIITVGRISASKNIELMLDAVALLHSRGIHVEFTIVGVPVTDSDTQYMLRLQPKLDANYVHYAGAQTQSEVAQLLCNHDIFINCSTTGSMDKAVLEAIYAGVTPVCSNPAFKTLLEPYDLFVEQADAQSLAQRLEKAASMHIEPLIASVRARYDLQKLIPALVAELS